MNKFWRTLIAAYGAKKLGGGCLSTILIFILIYWALGNCNSTPKRQPASLVKENKIAYIVPSYPVNTAALKVASFR
jgi:hypothetical protein